MPWKLLVTIGRSSSAGSAGTRLSGPCGGNHDLHYFVIRRRVLRVDDLYLRGGIYRYCQDSIGAQWRWRSERVLHYLDLRFLPCALYDYSWFVGFAVSFVLITES